MGVHYRRIYKRSRRVKGMINWVRLVNENMTDDEIGDLVGAFACVRAVQEEEELQQVPAWVEEMAADERRERMNQTIDEANA